MNKKSQIQWIFLIIITISAVLIGYLAYQNTQLKYQLSSLLKEVPLVTPQIKPYQTTSPNPKANSTTYITPNQKYQITYPPTWQVNASPANQWNKEGSPSFTLAKNDYQMTFSFPSAFGPGICIFPDNPNFTKSFPDNPIMDNSKCPGEYVEIIATNATYRRRIVDRTSKPNQVKWGVYTKSPSGDWTTVPPVNYFTPINPDLKIVLEMDKILSTFKSTQ